MLSTYYVQLCYTYPNTMANFHFYPFQQGYLTLKLELRVSCALLSERAIPT